MRRFRRIVVQFIVISAIISLPIVLASDTPDPGLLWNKLVARTSPILFNYVGWEIDAVLRKLGQEAASQYRTMSETQQSAFVHDYLQWVAKAQSYDSQINSVYSDARLSDSDKDGRSSELKRKRDEARSEVAKREPIAEGIAESQVAAVLRDEGFASLGEVLPPVVAHITQLPALLVISPRNEIRVETSVNVLTVPADQAEALESQIDRDLNMSSIIVPLGGLSLWPTMVIQTWHAPTLFEVIAHEWSHHYLFFFPLGLNYENMESRIINETTASLFGKEIGRKVVQRFYSQYPDIMAQLPPVTAAKPTPVNAAMPLSTPTAPDHDPDERPPFEYGAMMNETRITVDFFLHFGLVDQAEAYMETQRLRFSAHGYPLRKLNQAFFAFYGGYQGAGGSSAGGSDPIGPSITALRDRAPTVRAWLEQMRSITTRAGLAQAVSQESPPAVH